MGALSGIYVAIIGPAEPRPEVAVAAEELGRLVGEAGAIVVTGGRGGVMEAACRGAKQKGGTTVGLLPGLLRDEANPYVDIAIPTGMGEMRNMLIVRAADALIAVGKGYGTLSEIGFALREGKVVVGVETWALELDGKDGVRHASSPQEAVAILSESVNP